MRNFIVFFTEKEGSSVLMYLLNNFADIDIIHQINNQGWEPLNAHCSGHLSISSLRKLLHYIYAGQKHNITKINKLYTRTATLPLETFDKNRSIGFKMQLVPHQYIYPITQTRFKRWNNHWYQKLQLTYPDNFKQTVIDSLVENQVVVFLTIRQDVLRWALSKYHGDGTGKPGHMQFRMANGQLQAQDLKKITVDCDKLEDLISDCETEHHNYRQLADQLRKLGLTVCPLQYEQFLSDKQTYFNKVGHHLGLSWSNEQIDAAIAAGSFVKKVHSDKIENFVNNHAEVTERFADRFVSWDE